MTMINTDVPGVTVEVTLALPLTQYGRVAVRLVGWSERYDYPDAGSAHDVLADLRLTSEQAEQLAAALASHAHEAVLVNAGVGAPSGGEPRGDGASWD